MLVSQDSTGLQQNVGFDALGDQLTQVAYREVHPRNWNRGGKLCARGAITWSSALQLGLELKNHSKFMWQLKTMISPPPCHKTLGCLSTSLVGHYHVSCLVIHRVHSGLLCLMRKNMGKLRFSKGALSLVTSCLSFQSSLPPPFYHHFVRCVWYSVSPWCPWVLNQAVECPVLVFFPLLLLIVLRS